MPIPRQPLVPASALKGYRGLAAWAVRGSVLQPLVPPFPVLTPGHTEMNTVQAELFTGAAFLGSQPVIWTSWLFASCLT